MLKHYLLAVVGIVAALLAYADHSGMLYMLPERFAWVPIAVAVANLVIQQLRDTRVDRPDDTDTYY